MKRIDLEVKEREAHSKPRKMRRDGIIPGVMYGHGKPLPIGVDAKQFDKAIHNEAGLNALFDVKLGDKTTLSVIKDMQRGLTSHKPVHVDFQRINLKEKIELNIPTHSIGEAKGVKEEGGILEHMLREIEVRCLPDDIPASIDIDISGLGVHDSIKVQDITPPKGVEFLTEGDHIIFNVVMPRVEEEAPAPLEGDAAAAGAEPEVIAKGKKDEEEGAEGASAKAPAKAPAKEAKKEVKKEEKK